MFFCCGTFQIVDHYHKKILQGIHTTREEAEKVVETLVSGHRAKNEMYDYQVDEFASGLTYDQYCYYCL